jgi:hypothetical protein
VRCPVVASLVMSWMGTAVRKVSLEVYMIAAALMTKATSNVKITRKERPWSTILILGMKRIWNEIGSRRPPPNAK